MKRWRAAGAMVIWLAGAACAACGSDAPPAPTAPGPVPVVPPQTFAVTSVTDGDTLRFTPALSGSTALRFLDIDAPESAQSPWGAASRASLLELAPPGTELTIATEVTPLDSFDRVLGHATRRDGLSINVEQVRRGQAVLFVIWPNAARFAEYRAAQIEAQAAGRGVWNPAAPLPELPFVYRLRIDGDSPFRPVGDYQTRMYVEAADYARVSVHNRIFFNTRTDAASAGYTACPKDPAGAYAASCFGSATLIRSLLSRP